MASSSGIVKLTRLSSSSSWYRTCRKRPRSFLTVMEQRSNIINGTIGSCTTGGSSNGFSAKIAIFPAKRYFSTTDVSNSSLDRRISIGDVQVDTPPLGSGRPDLIPSLLSDHHHENLSSCQMGHLRWMLQKDLCLKQDFLLLGSAALARDRRHLLMLYAALIEREVEYMALSRDTSDADLKQRKEVSSSSGSEQSSSAIYINQAPVRAALYGRLLILDGLEKAERNVLPTLNNLLENRELSLDDGGLLVSSQIFDEYAYGHTSSNQHHDQDEAVVKAVNVNGTMIHRVHPDFRVAALSSDASVLDPPLRSRFQARVLHPLNPGDMLQYLMSTTRSDHNNSVDIDMVTKLIHMTLSISEDISLQSLEDAIRYLERTPNNLRNKTAIVNAYTSTMLRIEDHDMSENTKATNHNNTQSSFISTSTTDTIQDMISCAFDSGSRGVALVGPKGCYKSALARDLIRRQEKTAGNSQSSNLFSLYSDMTSRDLLCTRGTDTQGNTIWNDTPLTKAIKQGLWILLDGIDKVRSDTLTSLALLMEEGFVDLPNGTRLMAHSNFKCIALAHPPEEGGSDNNNQTTWITPEIKGMFHWIRVDSYPSQELYNILSKLYPSVDSKLLQQLVQLRDRLDQAIQTGAADSTTEQETLMLSMRKLKHICKRLNNSQQKQERSRGEQNDNDALLRHLIENAMMIHLMPDREQRIIRHCMNDCGIFTGKDTDETGRPRNEKNRIDRSTSSSFSLDEELLNQHRRILSSSSASSTNSLLIPRPIFEENPGHASVLRDLLEAHSVGEEALLIMGYQGVGKNRVVDYLLSKLHYEREYLQLHRDTTVQSLLVTPTIQDGRILYEDSPLVRAAIHGRILIMDEADKAPLEVVVLLKGLIEDRELALPDGRTLRYNDDFVCNDKDNHDNDNKEVIIIHSNFRIWALANPSTYPFHGNDISREMSDVFSCHLVPPLDVDSQRRILNRYGPNVLSDDIETILNVWNDLRVAHEKGLMAYPFSVREAVSVTKHLNSFSKDGLEGALENVIAFDRFDNITLKQLSKIFHKHGITTIGTHVESDNAGPGGTKREGGISTPRTRASMPKHGKVDPNNEPHVGGNTWAGGTGGSDTAGLGGRGGPYRLDLGHPVHQVSDEMKAQVSEEARRKAQQMARDGLEKKLQEVNMGELDWERYTHLQERVASQIQQLRLLLKDINQKRHLERTWIKRQSSGELDDSRIVDALVGEKDVFQKRGIPTEDSRTKNNRHHSSKDKMSIKLVVDISASMYRFNGYDGRLQTLLEATLMIMEALKDDDRFLLEIVGHNGDSPEIPLVEPTHYPKDPKTQLQILESMVAHTQYTFAGDHTVEAIELAVSKANENDLIVVISDANLRRYRIDPHEIGQLLCRNNTHANLVLIGNFGEEAHHLSRVVPNQRAQVCLDSQDLPLILKNIVASAAK